MPKLIKIGQCFTSYSKRKSGLRFFLKHNVYYIELVYWCSPVRTMTRHGSCEICRVFLQQWLDAGRDELVRRVSLVKSTTQSTTTQCARH